MTITLAILAVLLLAFAIFVLIKNKKLEDDMLRVQKETQAAIAEVQQESERKRQFYESETQRVYGEAQSAVAEAQKQLDQQFGELKQESERIRQHYEAEARKSQGAAEALLAKTLKDVEPLRKYETLRNAEEEMKRILDELSNASVPFAFDVHALIKSEDAPALETKLHRLFRDNQVNKNNFRKEFFRVTLTEIRQAIEKLKEDGLSFEMERDWIEKATAVDFYRSLKIEGDPQEMEEWRKGQERRANRLARESSRYSSSDDIEADGNNGTT